MEILEQPTDSVETPSPEVIETPQSPEVTPAEVTNANEVQDELYKLPDGREVDGATLYKEYTENLLPDYTRKSQELARLKTPTPETQLNNNTTYERYWEDPNWQPSTIQELRQSIRDAETYERQLQETQTLEQRQQVEAEIKKQIEDIKAVDKDLNENELFAHAHKFGFSNLKVAHDNLQLVKGREKAVEKRVVQNITKRNGEPVAGVPSGAGVNTGVDLSKFSNAQEALDYIAGQGK